jgi:hypothetical protein
VKNVLTIALTTVAIVSSSGIAAAQQYGERVPITRNYRGELACPSDYVIQGRSCISIYSHTSAATTAGLCRAPGLCLVR